jgi:hypothetical protein
MLPHIAGGLATFPGLTLNHNSPDLHLWYS